jgi:hypothetical protein
MLFFRSPDDPIPRFPDGALPRMFLNYHFKGLLFGHPSHIAVESHLNRLQMSPNSIQSKPNFDEIQSLFSGDNSCSIRGRIKSSQFTFCSLVGQRFSAVFIALS